MTALIHRWIFYRLSRSDGYTFGYGFERIHGDSGICRFFFPGDCHPFMRKTHFKLDNSGHDGYLWGYLLRDDEGKLARSPESPIKQTGDRTMFVQKDGYDILWKNNFAFVLTGKTGYHGRQGYALQYLFLYALHLKTSLGDLQSG